MSIAFAGLIQSSCTIDGGLVAFLAISALLHQADLAKEDPLAIDRVAGLFEREPQTRVLIENLLGLLPVDPDPGQWLAWFDGGSPPVAEIPLVDPDQGRKTSARGAQQSALAKWFEAQRQVRELKVKLEEAEGRVEERTIELRTANNQMRAVVAYRMIVEAGRLFAAPFAMGPMWTLVRAVSGYLRADVAYEASLDPAALAALEEHRVRRKETAAKILELLDWHCGDVALEVKLHETMLAVLEEHHKPIADEIANRNYTAQPLSEAAKRLRRRSDDRRATVRRGAPAADRVEVLGGLSRPAPYIHRESDAHDS